jgi:hypothetical protein
VARIKTRGMVITQSMSFCGEMDNPQPSPKASLCVAMDAVHRLNGGGSAFVGLRYSRSHFERSPAG